MFLRQACRWVVPVIRLVRGEVDRLASGEGDGYCGALALYTIDGYVATVLIDDLLDDGHSEAEAFFALCAALGGLSVSGEYVREFVGWYSYSLVGYGGFDQVTCYSFYTDSDLVLGMTELNGVRYEVVVEAFDAIGVRRYFTLVCRTELIVYDQFDVFGRGHVLQSTQAGF